MKNNNEITVTQPMGLALDGFQFKPMELVIEGKHTIEKWLDVGKVRPENRIGLQRF